MMLARAEYVAPTQYPARNCGAVQRSWTEAQFLWCQWHCSMYVYDVFWLPFGSLGEANGSFSCGRLCCATCSLHKVSKFSARTIAALMRRLPIFGAPKSRCLDFARQVVSQEFCMSACCGVDFVRACLAAATISCSCLCMFRFHCAECSLFACVSRTLAT